MRPKSPTFGKRLSPLVEQIANLHIERLPEGLYLATSDDIPGLVAQGRTLTETLEIISISTMSCRTRPRSSLRSGI